MRVISVATVRKFWERNRQAETPLRAWLKVVHRALWSKPADVKAAYASVSFVGSRLVFNIGGNNYRLVAAIAYAPQMLFVKWIGTHAEYDKIDVEEVNFEREAD